VANVFLCALCALWLNEFVVPKHRAFLLRIDPAVLDALQRWANDDLRSLNGQIEFVLRKALAESWRLKPGSAEPEKEKEAHDL
jgi:hypothetical protein